MMNPGEGDAVPGDRPVGNARGHESAGREVTGIGSAAQNIAVDHVDHREKKRRAENQLGETRADIDIAMRTEVSAADEKRTVKMGQKRVKMGWKPNSEFRIIFIFRK